MKMSDKGIIIKSVAISMTFFSIALIIILIGLYIFTVTISKQLSEFLMSIPLQNTIAYGTIASVLSYINKKYKK